MTKGFTYNLQPGTMDCQRDFPWVCRELMESEWGAKLTPEKIDKAMQGSRNFAIYELIDTNLLIVGFARVVTDGALFSSICDFIVTEKKRGQGFGRQLLEHILIQPGIKGTECVLHTTHARPFYEKFGFKVFKDGVLLRVL